MTTEPDNTDILVRLADWRSVHLARLPELIAEAATVIEALREAIRLMEATMTAFQPRIDSLSPMTITTEPEEDEDEDRIFHSATHKPD